MMTLNGKQLVRWVTEGWVQKHMGAWVFVVCLVLCLPGLAGLECKAQSPLAGVLIPQGAGSSGEPLALSRPEETLLLSLKQINPGISTIQVKELTNFKGKVVVLPLTDETPAGFLDKISGQNIHEGHFIIVPMLTRPNTQMEQFLQRMGFQVEGSRYIAQSLGLRYNGDRYNVVLPIGSFALNTTSRHQPFATWDNQYPAVVTSGKHLLISWSWSKPLPASLFTRFMEDWQSADHSVAQAFAQPEEAATAHLAMDASQSNHTSGSRRIAPELATSFGTVANVPTASTTTSPPYKAIPVSTEPKPAPAKSSTTAFRQQMAPQRPQLAMTETKTPPPVSPATTTPSASSATKPAQSAAAADDTIEDSTPDEMYDFDGGGKGAPKLDKAALRRMRSAEVQNAIAEYYNDRMRELANIQDKVNLMAGQSMTNPEKYAAIKEALDKSNVEKGKFETYWFQQNYGPALEAFENSKSLLMGVLFDKIPVSHIEGRAIWLDRGSIVKSGSPDGLRQLIRRIAASGFNIVYFETVNAGYPIYPSTMVEQNPQVKGWDPLAVAVDEAHKQNIELHAWVWVFAVGNTRHNRILGQPDSYPGPMLSKPELATEAMRGRNGELVLPAQYEYWLSPASFKARAFLTSLYSEIVTNYAVDGLQLDYIRYPFQKPMAPMGYESFALSRFTSETGLSPGDANEYTAKAWAAWKAFQVTTFVKDLNHKLKAINPQLKISAAVFPIARHSRMLGIQQDWETWVRNGWVDTINPMAYSRSARSLERLVQYIHNVGDDRTLVYPGLSLIKLNAIELLDTLEICRKTGVMGTTLFAVNQFDSDKQLLLQTGPYKQRKTVPPHRDPIYASAEMVRETLTLVQSLLGPNSGVAGSERLKEIHVSLQSLDKALTGVSEKPQSSDAQFLVSGMKDDARVLKQQSEQWAEWSGDSVAGFQAGVVKQMVDKVVRMINYTTFQWANAQKFNTKFATFTEDPQSSNISGSAEAGQADSLSHRSTGVPQH